MIHTLFDAAHTVYLAVPQPEPVQPPGGPKLWQFIGVTLWVLTGGAVLGVIIGGGWMWVDHMTDRGATSGKGIKVVLGAVGGAGVMSIAAALVTWAMS